MNLPSQNLSILSRTYRLLDALQAALVTVATEVPARRMNLHAMRANPQGIRLSAFTSHRALNGQLRCKNVTETTKDPCKRIRRGEGRGRLRGEHPQQQHLCRASSQLDPPLHHTTIWPPRILPSPMLTPEGTASLKKCLPSTPMQAPPPPLWLPPLPIQQVGLGSRCH